MLHSAHFKGVWEARSVHAERAAASHGCLLLQRGGSDLNFERHVRAHMVYCYRTFTMDFTMLFTIIVINSSKSVQNSNFYNINKNATLALQKALHICRITT